MALVKYEDYRAFAHVVLAAPTMDSVGKGAMLTSQAHALVPSAFAHPTDPENSPMIPGEIITRPGDVELNAGRKTVTLAIANTGDRPIQVGSHYHFFETNPALKFERENARGMRLDIAAGTAVRFEPGQTREVTLVALDGSRAVYGFRQEVMGKL